MKIFLDSIGCRLNQAEIERIALQFRIAGHEIVGTAEKADLAVINTCTVTRNAAADSRKVIRRAINAGAEKIIATGCWATMEPESAAELSHHVVLNNQKENLVSDYLNLQPSTFEIKPLERIPLPGYRARTRAFIKVQDGCDNECTFCITTVARGAGISRPLVEIIMDIQSALDGGAKEAVLTGVNLGSWSSPHPSLPPEAGEGAEFSLLRGEIKEGGRMKLLIQSILNQTSTPRLRLSSLEPWDLEPDLFKLWENPRLMPHLHLPLQSGSDSVLRRMRRNTTREEFSTLVASVRAVIPDIAITTDIIAGFPGETEDEFAETLDFVREMNFAGGHIFTYSPRKNTPAARMKNHLDKKTRKARNAILREFFTEMELNYRKKFIDKRMNVLWESSKELDDKTWQMQGLTENYLRVRASASEPRWNQIDQVRLAEIEGNVILGEIL